MENKDPLKKDLEQIKILSKLTEQLSKMNKYLEENEKKVTETFKKKVTKWGNSCHIPLPKKYEGHDAVVKILKKENEKEEKKI